MVVAYIVDFTSYLNTKGFNISNDRIVRFFCVMQNEEIDFTNQEDILGVMRSIFCSNQVQYELLPKYFESFFKEDIQAIERHKEKNEKQLQTLTSTKKEEIQQIRKELDSITRELKARNNGIENLLNKQEDKFIRENLPLIKKLKTKDKEMMNFISDCMIEKDIGKFLNYSSTFMEDIGTRFVLLSETALVKGKIEEFHFYEKMFHIIKKLEKLKKRYSKLLNAELKNATSSQVDKILTLEREIEWEERKHKQVQRNLDNMIQEMENVQKASSVHHREVFIGNRSVQLTEKAEQYMETDFRKLDKDALDSIYHYIKRNLLKFKTRMTRNIHTSEKQKIDVKTTIQNACKTGGLPFHIYYEKPKANRTKLILVLDVSGSCKDASKMMLTFMYLLQSVFPGGCKTFAFVDSLYDISDIMDTEDINHSIASVLNIIPRKGVYSNYYKPLHSLWQEKRHEITSDSIVIFMGDARNNNNPTGIEYIRNISRKVKKAYWLNTEKFEKWGYADSLAFDYAKYFKMYEVLNATDLIHFINAM